MFVIFLFDVYLSTSSKMVTLCPPLSIQAHRSPWRILLLKLHYLGLVHPPPGSGRQRERQRQGQRLLLPPPERARRQRPCLLAVHPQLPSPGETRLLQPLLLHQTVRSASFCTFGEYICKKRDLVSLEFLENVLLLRSDDGDGSENVAEKVNSRSFNLHCDYSKSLTLSNVGKPSEIGS